MTKKRYEVVDYVRGGYFVHGGMLGEMFIENKSDADLIAEALNFEESLSKNKVKIRDAEACIEELESILGKL